MNLQDEEALWRRLRDAGLVQGDVPASVENPPWFLRVMSGVSGWIGALFLLGFVGAGMAFVMHSASASVLVGLLACGAALPLLRMATDFSGQFGFALSLAGQALLLTGFNQALPGDGIAVALLMVLVELLLFFVAAQFLHRVWSLWAAALAVSFVLAKLHALMLAPALLAFVLVLAWRAEFRLPRWSAPVPAAVYALALALSSVTLVAAGVHDFRLDGVPAVFVPAWLGGLLNGILLVWAVSLLVPAPQQASPSGSASSGSGLLLLAGVPALASLLAPGLASLLLVLLLGQAGGNRVLAGLGVFSLLAYLAVYYYTLSATLLEKSLLMLCTGLVLLGMRLLLRRYWPETAAGERRHA